MIKNRLPTLTLAAPLCARKVRAVRRLARARARRVIRALHSAAACALTHGRLRTPPRWICKRFQKCVIINYPHARMYSARTCNRSCYLGVDHPGVARSSTSPRQADRTLRHIISTRPQTIYHLLALDVSHVLDHKVPKIRFEIRLTLYKWHNFTNCSLKNTVVLIINK